MALLETVEWAGVFAVTILFTLISIGSHKEIHFKWLAAVCWFVFAIVHFIVGDKTSALTYALAFLWMGLGLVFTVWGISSFFEVKKDKVWKFES